MTSKRQQLDEGYIKKIYQEICEHVEESKKVLKPDEQAFDNWAKIICQPKFKLIKNLVYLLEQEDTDFQDKEMIFSIFNHILLINPNSANQMIKFDSLPKILVDYLFQYKKEKEKNDVCAINTLSYTFKNCLGIFPPIRDPVPPAKIIAIFFGLFIFSYSLYF